MHRNKDYMRKYIYIFLLFLLCAIDYNFILAQYVAFINKERERKHNIIIKDESIM